MCPSEFESDEDPVRHFRVSAHRQPAAARSTRPGGRRRAVRSHRKESIGRHRGSGHAEQLLDTLRTARFTFGKFPIANERFEFAFTFDATILK